MSSSVTLENILDDEDYEMFFISLKYVKDGLFLNVFFSIIPKEFDYNGFLNGKCSLKDNSGEVNGSNWSLTYLPEKGYEYSLESNCGGEPYCTYMFAKDDPYMIKFLEKLQQICKDNK